MKDLEILHNLFLLRRKVHKIIRDSDSELPLSRTEMMTLKIIEQNDNVTVGFVSKFFDIRKSSASILLHKLEEKGLISFSLDENDKRIQIIKLKKSAYSVLQKMNKLMKVHSQTLLRNLTEEEKTLFVSILEKII